MYKLAISKSSQASFALMALYCGAAFFMLGMAGWSAMDPAQYGEIAVAFEIEAMAGVQMCGALFLCFGLLINGRWRWSAGLRLFGAVIIVILIAGLTYSSILARDGWPFAVYLIGFLGWGLVVIWWNMVDLRAAIMWGENGKAV